MIGETIGSYRITAKIGAGGMGEVYRATDTRLGRDVAIKFSPDQFTERFELEARTIASLNHPNICTVYDVGYNHLVMELIDGFTLAERIAQGPIPEDEALHIARQIAAALEAAHEAHVVHRDLKPGNVKIRPDGTVKVLDFGLAKVGATPTAHGDQSQAVTMSPTQAGMILGTAAYMSPEQARGRPVDKRADIWAFGVVFYEMLTGKPVFAAGNTSDTLAAVIRDEPDWAKVPQKFRRLLRKCLEKDPRNRLRDIGDMQLLLDEVPAATKVRSGVPWMVAGILAIASVIAGLGWWSAAYPPDQVLRPVSLLDVDLGTNVSLGSAYGADVIISYAGDRLVFVSQGKLHTRRLDEATASALAGTEGAATPFFSPDGKWIGFFAQGKLKKISVEGGAVRTLAEALAPRGATWTQGGQIILALNGTGGLSSVSDEGGNPVPVTTLDEAERQVTHRWPQMLPGDTAVLYTAHTTVSNFDEASIEVMPMPSKGAQPKRLPFKGYYARYLPSGHITFMNQGGLFAVPFNLDRLESEGIPVPVLEGVGSNSTFGFAQYDFARDGTLVYRKGGSGTVLVTIDWLERSGRATPLLAKPGYYNRIRLSPNGERLAMTGSESSSQDIWIYDWRSGNKTLVTFGGIVGDYPLWSSDGQFLAFSVKEGIGWTRADGSSPLQPLTQSKILQYPWSFTADDKTMAFMEVSQASGYDLWTVPIEKSSAGLKAGKPEPFLVRSADDRHPAISPDGRWMAYSSSHSGAFQVWVRPFPAKGEGQWLVGAGLYAAWSPNGRELFFRTEDNRVMVVSYSTKGDVFIPSKAQPWSSRPIASVGVFRNYDVAAGGERIVALMPATGPEAEKVVNHVLFVENFFDEIRRRITGSSR